MRGTVLDDTVSSVPRNAIPMANVGRLSLLYFQTFHDASHATEDIGCWKFNCLKVCVWCHVFPFGKNTVLLQRQRKKRLSCLSVGVWFTHAVCCPVQFRPCFFSQFASHVQMNSLLHSRVRCFPKGFQRASCLLCWNQVKIWIGPSQQCLRNETFLSAFAHQLWKQRFQL